MEQCSAPNLADLPAHVLSEILWESYRPFFLKDWLDLRTLCPAFDREISRLLVVRDPAKIEHDQRALRPREPWRIVYKDRFSKPISVSSMPHDLKARYLQKLIKIRRGRDSCHLIELIGRVADSIWRDQEESGFSREHVQNTHDDIVYELCMAFATREYHVSDHTYDESLCSLLKSSSEKGAVISGKAQLSHVACGAAYLGAKDLMLATLERVLPEDVVSSYFGGIISAAVRAGHADIVKILLNRGHALQKMRSPHWASKPPIETCTTCSLAAAYGHLDIMKLLPNEPPQHGMYHGLNDQRTLLFAVRGRNKTVVDCLLTQSLGAGKSPPSHIANGMLWMAARCGQVGILRDAIEAGGDIDQLLESPANRPLAMASRKGHEDVVQLLIDMGIDINGPFEYRTVKMQTHVEEISVQHPMGIAVARGHVGVCKRLLDGGVDVNWKGGVWMTIASACGQTRVMECLDRKGFSYQSAERLMKRYASERASMAEYHSVMSLLKNHGMLVNDAVRAGAKKRPKPMDLD
ncbi:MAG: Ankyrin repeat domain-containing protein 44 [Alyxoria varia]|nr:MAG: Ankyrin repeat domain-containing protein 44 [Alyxoria varia]